MSPSLLLVRLPATRGLPLKGIWLLHPLQL